MGNLGVYILAILPADIKRDFAMHHIVYFLTVSESTGWISLLKLSTVKSSQLALLKCICIRFLYIFYPVYQSFIRNDFLCVPYLPKKFTSKFSKIFLDLSEIKKYRTRFVQH